MRTLLISIFTTVFLASSHAGAAEVGQELTNVELRDGSTDKPSPIPDFGKKVIAVFYTDADVADMNDPLADVLKAKNLDETVYRGLGIANLADSKAPNFIIKGVVKGKIDKYKSTILTDADHSLSKGWTLGDCNNTSVVLVLGKDKKVHYLHKGGIRGKDIETVVALVEKLMKE